MAVAESRGSGACTTIVYYEWGRMVVRIAQESYGGQLWCIELLPRL